MTERAAHLFGLAASSLLLEQALTHPSFANERKDATDNQRLEFLGDAVLQLCTSELLYRRYTEADEGTLTRWRAMVVNADYLADWGRSHGLPEELLLGKGADSGGLRTSTNVVADAVEACIAAAYLDGGYAHALEVCRQILEPSLEQLPAQGSGRDAKSELQELAQSLGLGLPHYLVVDSGGPAHERWFEVEVRLGESVRGKGRGRSKRVAERTAAEAVLSQRERLLSEVSEAAKKAEGSCEAG